MARRERLVRVSCWVIALAALALVVERSDIRGALPVLGAAGPVVLLGLVPYTFQIGLDALAWRRLLRALGYRVAWRTLFEVRLATEAVLMTMPGGSIVGESLKPYLLGRAAAVPVPHTIASIGIKRALLAGAQAVYLGLAVALGFATLAAHSQEIIGTTGLPWLAAGAAAVLALAAAGLGLAFARGKLAHRVRTLLARLPSRRLRRGIEARRVAFRDADAAFATLGARRSAIAGAAALLLGAWLVETAETWVLCRVVGADVAIVHVLAMEASVVFLRNAAFFLPAGLGVQDAGYLAFLGAYGVAAPIAAAFVIVKRLKELVWVGAGYGVLYVLDRRPTLVALGGVA